MGEPGLIPKHIAIIMDGNGRWAEKRGLNRSAGHKAGAEPVRTVLKEARRLGVQYLTLYAFSTENWGRPHDEVSGLFELLVRYLDSETQELMSTGVRFTAVGDLASLPDGARQALEAAMAATAANSGITLCLALSYGSRAELAAVAKSLAFDAASGRIKPEDIDEAAIGRRLWTNPMPEPDLLIRTGGDQRLSNFLLWQCAYAELYFTNTLWPDFGADDLQAAVGAFSRRERRFGLTGEQTPKGPCGLIKK